MWKQRGLRCYGQRKVVAEKKRDNFHFKSRVLKQREVKIWEAPS